MLVMAIMRGSDGKRDSKPNDSHRLTHQFRVRKVIQFTKWLPCKAFSKYGTQWKSAAKQNSENELMRERGEKGEWANRYWFRRLLARVVNVLINGININIKSGRQFFDEREREVARWWGYCLLLCGSTYTPTVYSKRKSKKKAHKLSNGQSEWCRWVICPHRQCVTLGEMETARKRRMKMLSKRY